MRKKATILSIFTAAIMILSLTGCGEKNNTVIDKELIDMENSRIENSSEEITDLSVTKEDLKDAIKSNSYIYNNFDFTEQQNKVAETLEDKYSAYETTIFTGKTKDTNELEGANTRIEISISSNVGKEYPSNVSISFESDNDIDFDNLTSYSYKLIGELFPPKLASEFQNAAFEGLTEGVFTYDGLTASIYKETYKSESNTVIANLNIILSEGVDEIVYTEKQDITMSIGEESKIYDIGIFEYNDTLDKIEDNILNIFDCDDMKISLLSLYENFQSIDNTNDTEKEQSVYLVGQLLYQNIPTEFSLSSMVDTNGDMNISIKSNTKTFDTLDLALESAENTVKQLINKDVKISLNESSEYTCEIDNYTVSFKLITDDESKYSVEISIETLKNQEKSKETNN